MTVAELLPIKPDEKGIVTLEINGESRRFVKNMLLSILEQKEIQQIDYDFPAKATIKKAKQLKKQVKKNPVGYHVRKPVVAILPDGTKKKYESHTLAADDLKVAVTGITNTLKGRQNTTGGIQFQATV